MPTTIYLEADDEITAAVGRIRALKESEAVIVISRSSRIGSSRINFKLLAREAHQQGVNLVLVSDEPTVRALAVSAGLPAYDNVGSATEALDQFRRQDEQLARRTGKLPGEPRPQARSTTAGAAVAAVSRPAAPEQSQPRPKRPSPSSVEPRQQTQVLPVSDTDLGGELARGREERALEREAVAGRRRRRHVPVAPLLFTALLLAVVAGGVYAAYLYLPTATITLRPETEPLGPLEVRVTADPSVAVPDAAAGAIPAERIQLPLSVSGEFPATGVEVTRTPASGTVRFHSENTVFDVPIPAGTIVATADGIEFETLAAITLPRASFETGPTRETVEVQARTDGPRGNVAERTITQLPADLAAAVISVTNPRPTSGGTRVEQSVVAQEDYDAAVAQLRRELTAQLSERLADPATTPGGLTLFPVTARSQDPSADPTPTEVVGRAAESFTVTMEATATVLAVNQALVEQVAAERLQISLGAGQNLLGGSVEVDHDSGTVLGSTIVYDATATGRVFREPDREALVDNIKGKTVSEARAILEAHGTAEISIWPDVVDRVPDQAARISLNILPPRENP